MGDFDQILNCWLGQFPKGQVPMDPDNRIAAFTDLFETFKKQGFIKEYFSNTVKGKITNVSINPNHPHKQKKRKWIQYVVHHMNIAFHTVYQEAIAQEENPLAAPSISEEDMKVDIEEDIKEYTSKQTKPKKEKVEYFAENAPKGAPTTMKVDPEMAKLLGLDTDE